MDCLNSSMEFKTENDLYIETWLTKMGKINVNVESRVDVKSAVARRQKSKPELKIHCAKRELCKALDIIEELKVAQSNLKENLTTMSSGEWNLKAAAIGVLKEKLNLAMSHFGPEALVGLKRSLEKRSRKRLNQRLRRAENKQIREDECQKQHEKIDRWLENMKDSVERAKAEESMKKDADCVLAEVTKKKADARKQLALLAALSKLRSVREVAAKQRGERIDEDDAEAFRDTNDKLVNAWSNCLRTYVKEEQGLRIMLEQNEEGTKKHSSINKEKKVASDWERVLFGQQYVPDSDIYWGLTLAERDFETFVAIRKSWDTFLHRSEGSKIPVGWVLPNASGATSDWGKYLQK